MDRFLLLWHGERWPGRFCDAEFPKLHRSAASTLDVANQTVSTIHSSDCDCNAKRLERELGAWKTSEFDNSGTASGISRSRHNETQDRSWTGSCVNGLDGTTLCMGCKHFPSEGNRGERLIVLSGARITLEKLYHLEKCAWGETILKKEPS